MEGILSLVGRDVMNDISRLRGGMTLETITSEDVPDDDQEGDPAAAPRPPPRYKRKVKLRGVENLNLEQINTSEDRDDDTHQNDILFKVCGSHPTSQAQHGLGKQNDLVEGKTLDGICLPETISKYPHKTLLEYFIFCPFLLAEFC